VASHLSEETITSRENKWLKIFRAALRGTGPASGEPIGVEGPKLVEDALRSGLEAEALLVSEAGEASELERLLRAAGESVAGIPRSRVLRTTDKLFASVAGTETPQGVAALFRQPVWEFDDVVRGAAGVDGALRGDAALVVVMAAVQDPGFFTSVSSTGTGSAMNAIVWAVGRPTTSPPAPAYVTLYAYDPKAGAAATAQGKPTTWLFSHNAGTWPNTGGNANIVPVVANGRVYVASYKQLAIFGLPKPSAAGKPEVEAQLAVPPPPPPPKLPPNGHEIFGTITTVAGGNITLATRTGKLVRVDAAGAVHKYRSVVLLIGEPVTVFGSYASSGVLNATRVLHAKPSPKGWPADR